VLTDEEHVALLEEVGWAIWHTAADSVGVDPYDGPRGRRRQRRDPASVVRGPGRNAALAHVAVAELVAKEVARIAAAAARHAAMLGADYGEIGQAAGITRQGARRRWPGLTPLTTAARARQDPRPRPHPTPPEHHHSRDPPPERPAAQDRVGPTK